MMTRHTSRAIQTFHMTTSQQTTTTIRNVQGSSTSLCEQLSTIVAVHGNLVHDCGCGGAVDVLQCSSVTRVVGKRHSLDVDEMATTVEVHAPLHFFLAPE